MAKEKNSFFQAVEGEIVNAAEDYVKSKVKNKLMRIGEFSILVFLALIMISIGIAYLVGHYVPVLNNGLNFVLLGMIFLIIGFFVRG